MKKTIIQIVEVIVTIVAIITAKYLGILYLIFLLVGWLGWYLGLLYSKNHKENSLTKFVAWVNLATWFIPIVGFFTVFASFAFNTKYGERNKIYLVFAIIGLVLSVINGIAGVIINL